MLIYTSLFLGLLVQCSLSRPQSGDPCAPSPCGVNSKCRVDDGRAICSCQATFIGNPITGCKHQCETDNQCDSSLACINFRCKDPCKVPRACATYAICKVINHQVDCTCPENFIGEGSSHCEPECVNQEECPATLACIGNKCGNPCEVTSTYKGQCGKNADCRVESHKAICFCPKRWKGHPFEACYPPDQ